MAVESSVRLRVDGRGAERELNRVNKAAQLLQGTVAKVSAALAGVGAVGGILRGFQEAEDAAAAVRTLGVDSQRLKKELAGVSQELKGTVSETKLLAASYDVASAGFNNAASAAQILKASALGAKGGLSDLNTVANATTSVLNAYGLSSDKAAKLVDGFIQTQNDGKIVVAQYAQQIGRVAPIAAAAGVGIDELNAAISTVTAQGLPIESTFAGLRQVIASVIKPTKEAQDAAKNLGIDFSSAAIKANGFGGFLEDVVEKTGGSEVEMTKLFGSVEAIAAILPLTSGKLKTFNKNLENQADSAGAAAKAAKEMANTVSGQVERIINNVGNLARSFDEVFGPGLKDSLKDLNALLQSFIGFVRGIDTEAIKAAVSMAGFTAKVLLAQKAFLLLQKAAIVNFLAKAIPMLITSKGKMVLLRFATIKLKAAMIGLKAALPFGAMFIAIDLVVGKIVEANRVQQEFNDLIESGGKAALEAASKQLDARRQVLEAQMQGLGTNRNDKGTRIRIQRELDAIDTSQGKILGRLGEIEDAANATALAAQQDAEAARLAAEAEERRLKAKQAQEMLDKQRATQKGTLQDRIRALQREGLLNADITDKQRRGLEYAFAQADLKRQFPQLTEEELMPLREIMQSTFQIKENAIERNASEKDTTTALTEQEKQYQRIADVIQNGIVDGIYQAIEGSQSLAESFSGILKQLGRIFLAKGIGSFKNQDGTGGSGLLGLLGFANGGRPPVGRPSIVGERGPELFVPSRAGTIIPNHELGGSTSVVVNVDASGTEVQGNQGNADQLGRLIGQAVQAELIKQKRPGGLLTR